ncbi:MAG TPA: SDR family oxidoreductase [Candidatus Acidoferrales bacterium]|nr:SDR family oxidoreductase [Candidatus Acidoferrales bacterium]
MSTKIAVITGASRGLGRNMALHLAARGVEIVGTYNSRADEAEGVAREIVARGSSAQMLQLDCGSAASIAAFAQALPPVLKDGFRRTTFDYLINNAGMGVYANFVDTTEEQLDRLYAVHVKAPFLLSQKLLPLMEDGGRIINLSSGLARFSLPGYSAYASMKGAIEVLTRYMAKELGARRITVNVVAPGAIETDFGGGVVRDNPEINKNVASTIPLGRAGLPDDVGGAVAALLSEDCGWINGTRIEVSGGQNI